MCLVAAGCSQGTPLDQLDDPLLKHFGRSSLTIESDAKVHAFSVYIAQSPEHRSQGLMFVEHLPKDVGMLFFFDKNRPVSMWMKNTVLPLDMLFVLRSGKIESIAHDTTPGSLKPVASKGDVCCVLELNAGTARRLGLKPGDYLRHPAFVQ